MSREDSVVELDPELFSKLERIADAADGPISAIAAADFSEEQLDEFLGELLAPDRKELHQAVLLLEKAGWEAETEEVDRLDQQVASLERQVAADLPAQPPNPNPPLPEAAEAGDMAGVGWSAARELSEIESTIDDSDRRLETACRILRWFNEEVAPASQRDLKRRLEHLRGRTASCRRLVIDHVNAMAWQPERVSSETQYRLAGAKLQSRLHQAEGVVALRMALEHDPQHERASRIIRSALDEGAEEDGALFALYEEVARNTGDSQVLLDFLERKAAGPDVTANDIREAVECAREIGALDRAEPLLERALQIAADEENGPEVRWAMRQLAGLCLHRDDVDGALAWLQQAALTAEGDEAFDLTLAVAEIASDASETHSRVAAEAYRNLIRQAYRKHADDQQVGERLRSLGESIAANQELAEMFLADAEHANEAQKVELLRHAGRLLIEAGDSANGLAALERATQIRPEHQETVLYMADVHANVGRFDDAAKVLLRAIESHHERAPAVAVLQHRMAEIAQAKGEAKLQMQWLHAALDTDVNNVDVASELAEVAISLGEHDVAISALRAVALGGGSSSMARAKAFLLQARIAHERGENRKALLWGHKAKSEDPNLTEVDELLNKLQR